MAEISGHDADFIWNRMPLARGRQYQTAWYQKRGFEFEEIGAESPLQKKIQ